MNDDKVIFNYLKNHQIEELKNFINDNENIDINIKDSNNEYLIGYAVMYNNIDLVEFLLKKNAYIDVMCEDGKNVLHIAIKYNYLDMIDLILKYNKQNTGISILLLEDKKKYTPLHYAILYNNYIIIKKLIDNGSNVNVINYEGYNALHLAIFNKSIDICKLIINNIVNINDKSYNGETVLHLACSMNLIEIINLLLENENIDINIQDYEYEFTAMHYLIMFGYNDIMKKIITRKEYNPNIQDVYGNTVLHYAIIENNHNAYELLITLKNMNYNLWNVNLKIPLHIAICNYKNDNYDYIEKILEYSNLNIQDNNGNTCMHYLCIDNKWKKYINMLSKKKINIIVQNNKLMTPIQYLSTDNQTEFMNMIIGNYMKFLRMQKNKWINEWENICSNEEIDNDKQNKLKNILQNENINENLCEQLIIKNISDGFNLLKMKNEKNKCSKNKIYSYPKKTIFSCMYNYIYDNVFICTFSGISIDILMGLIYLMKKYKNTSSIVSSEISDIDELKNFYNSIGYNVDINLTIFNFEILWSHHNIYFPKNFNERFIELYNNQNIEFILIPLGIELNIGSHANYIIIDKQKNEIERFEPNGSNAPYKFDYNPEMLDEILENKFLTLNKNIKYYPPKSYLPKIGFQRIIGSEKNDIIGDPGGFCGLWVILYVDIRLQYKNIDRNKIIKYMIDEIKFNNKSFKSIVRNYGIEITNIRDAIFNDVNININDWINEVYTDKQINEIIIKIKNIIKLLHK
jgi:ankyrin repeat protein